MGDIAMNSPQSAGTHDSDCAVHNEPAYPAGPCDCKTPRTDAALPEVVYSASAKNHDEVSWRQHDPKDFLVYGDDFTELLTVARQLERDLRQALDDANQDAKRLIDDKMKFFERNIELERELSELKHDMRIAGEAQRELAEAERLILAAVDMMTPDQVGNWTGVRAWLERSGGQGART